MLCTSCGEVAVADTWIPGSDALELAAWCCLGVPGLVYCAWRHLQRTKLCPGCGGGHLVREARASRRAPEDGRAIARVYSRGAASWPPPLRTPRQRMRPGAALAGLGLLAVAASGLAPAPEAGGEALGHSAALLGMSWTFVQIALFHRPPAPWQAWDEAGRALRVELA